MQQRKVIEARGYSHWFPPLICLKDPCDSLLNNVCPPTFGLLACRPAMASADMELLALTRQHKRKVHEDEKTFNNNRTHLLPWVGERLGELVSDPELADSAPVT